MSGQLLDYFVRFCDSYTIVYSCGLSFIWLVGAWLARQSPKVEQQREFYPEVTICLAAYNEAETIGDLLTSLQCLEYPSYSLLIIDDCSTDQTVAAIEDFYQKNSKQVRWRLIKQPKNQGKAHALNQALKLVESKYMLVVDADSYLEKEALHHLVNALETHPQTAAVTGKPIVRNRSTILGRAQTLEYVSIIDAIKRTQNLFLGAITTVSGVLVLYRVSALRNVGGFDTQAQTEDIDMTWRFYQAGWQVRYEERACSYILVPEITQQLLKQRKRWALGGLEVLSKNWHWVYRRGNWAQLFLLLEMVASHLWSWTFLVSFSHYIIAMFVRHEFHLSASVLSFFMLISVLLFLQGIRNNRKTSLLTLADKAVVPVYMTIYWLVNLVASLTAEAALCFGKSKNGRWDSPDRGV